MTAEQFIKGVWQSIYFASLFHYSVDQGLGVDLQDGSIIGCSGWYKSFCSKWRVQK